MRFPQNLLLSSVAVVVLLSGCGQVATAIGADDLTSTGSGAMRELTGLDGADGTALPGGCGRHGRGGPMGRGGHGGPGFLPPGVALTAEQKTAVKALMDRYKPAAPADGAKPGRSAGKAVREALLAATVDEAALRAAIAAQATARAGHKPPAPPVELLTGIRALLTADQLAAVVAKLEAAPTGRPADAPGRTKPDMAAGLTLTDVQKAALVAFQAKLEARRPARPDHAAHRAAMLAFWKNGDTTALAAMAPPSPPAPPTEEIVALALVLDATQRQAVFGRGFGGHRHGRHGGRGGRPMGAPPVVDR